jgi:hypothetical protein
LRGEVWSLCRIRGLIRDSASDVVRRSINTRATEGHRGSSDSTEFSHSCRVTMLRDRR